MDKALNKAEFIARFAPKGYTKKDADVIVDDIFRTITEILAEGKSVRFQGFGSFEVRDVKDRESTNPQTQEPLLIPGHKAPKFVAGKLLRRAVKEGFLRE